MLRALQVVEAVLNKADHKLTQVDPTQQQPRLISLKDDTH